MICTAGSWMTSGPMRTSSTREESNGGGQRTSLLDEGGRLFDGLRHLETDEDDCKAPPTERRCSELVEHSDAALATNYAHVIPIECERSARDNSAHSFCRRLSVISRRKGSLGSSSASFATICFTCPTSLLYLRGQRRQRCWQDALVVIFSLLDVILSQYLYLPDVLLLLVVIEVDLLEELLLVVLQLPHDGGSATGAALALPPTQACHASADAGTCAGGAMRRQGDPTVFLVPVLVVLFVAAAIHISLHVEPDPPQYERQGLPSGYAMKLSSKRGERLALTPPATTASRCRNR